MTAAARYLWAHPFGQVAVMLVVIGVTGLSLRYWTALPLVYVMAHKLPPVSYQPRHRRLACGNHRMVRGKAHR